MLEGVQRRDPKALGRFFDATFSYVYSIAMRLTGDRQHAEDVTQDVFMKVYRAAHHLQVDRSLKPWLTTITYNTCRDRARRAAVRPENTVDALKIAEWSAQPGTPEDALLEREREQLIERALRALDEQSRAVVVLHDFCGWSHDNIASVMDTSHAAVRKRYSRALKQMAQFMRGLSA